MRYQWSHSRGLFTGSRAVEASSKTVIAERLRQARMHWTTVGADAIIALRCREASTWEASCSTTSTQTRTTRPGTPRMIVTI
jgi:hypothetical protein